MKKRRSILNFLSNLLFPKDIKCIFCDEELFNGNKYCICEKCSETLPYSGPKVCEKCGETIYDMATLCINCKNNSSKPYEKAFAPFIFKDKIVEAIHKLKYHNAKWLAEYLGEFLFEELNKQDINVDIIVPIPLNEKRLKERGYNQAEIVCCKFKENGFTVDTKNLLRIKYTETQTTLTRVERKENLKDAFEVIDKNVYKGKTILLVDDVFTTGATMEEACNEILKSKPKAIYCLTIAHVSGLEEKYV